MKDKLAQCFIKHIGPLHHCSTALPVPTTCIRGTSPSLPFNLGDKQFASPHADSWVYPIVA